MKNINLQIRNACLAAFALLFLFNFPAFAQYSKYDIDPDAKNYAEDPLFYGPKIAGVWKTQVRITNCNGITLFGFESMGLFGADGTFLDTNVTDPKLRSSAFGYWDHVQGNQYKFVSRWFRFAEDGTYLGSSVVRHVVVLSLDGLSYESAGSGTMYYPDGTVQSIGCSEASAQRFK